MSQHPFSFAFPLSNETIIRQRAQILKALMQMDPGFASTPILRIEQPTLDTALALYDRLFLNSTCANRFRHLCVTQSARLTSSAGKFIYSKNALHRTETAEIRMSSDIFPRLTVGPFHLNGLHVFTPQEAFLIVFEHELCHAVETALFGQTGHSKRFLSLANGLFGHTDVRHALSIRRSEAAVQGVLVGGRAGFVYKGKALSGVITYVGKTATVMVLDPRGAYCDKSGKRYAKYRVPLPLLRKT